MQQSIPYRVENPLKNHLVEIQEKFDLCLATSDHFYYYSFMYITSCDNKTLDEMCEEVIKLIKLCTIDIHDPGLLNTTDLLIINDTMLSWVESKRRFTKPY